MLYRWGDGNLEITTDSVVLTFEGRLTQTVKKAASPRRIPFTAIADVVVRKPGFSDGYLRLLVAGSGDRKHRPSFDLDTVILKRKEHHAQAEAAADRLRGLIAGPEAIPAPAEPSFGQPARSARRKKLLQQVSADGRRPDIAEATALMSWTLFGRRELRHLHEFVRDSESVQFIVQGMFGDCQGILVLTSERLMFLQYGMSGGTVDDFPLDQVTAVSVKKGATSGSLLVTAAGSRRRFESIVNADLAVIADALGARIGPSASAGTGPGPRLR